jgi:hypothetical protein
VYSQSVEFGKKGINNNVGFTWYPLMAKNVYRLSSDQLELDKLLGSRLVKPATRSKKVPGQLKPLKLTKVSRSNSAKSAAPLSTDEAVPHGGVTSEDCSQHGTAGQRQGQEHSAPLGSAGRHELTANFTESAYFKSLFKSHAAVKKTTEKTHKSLPKLHVYEGQAYEAYGLAPITPTHAEEDFSDELQTRPTTGPIGHELAQFSTTSTTDVECSTSLLMVELKEAVHNLLLSHPATPRELDASPPALSPPSHQHSSSMLGRANSHHHAVSGPAGKLTFDNMLVAGKPLLQARGGEEGDEVSLMHSVNSAASMKSWHSAPPRPTVQPRGAPGSHVRGMHGRADSR